jgi:hypothetical protein
MTRILILAAALIAIAVAYSAEPTSAAPRGGGGSHPWNRCRDFGQCIYECDVLPNDKHPRGRKFRCFMWCIHTCPPD